MENFYKLNLIGFSDPIYVFESWFKVDGSTIELTKYAYQGSINAIHEAYTVCTWFYGHDLSKKYDFDDIRKAIGQLNDNPESGDRYKWFNYLNPTEQNIKASGFTLTKLEDSDLPNLPDYDTALKSFTENFIYHCNIIENKIKEMGFKPRKEISEEATEEHDELEVDHTIFFWQNIKRVWNLLFKKWWDKKFNKNKTGE